MWNFTAMIQGVSKLKEAMECGKEVADPALWKNRSLTTDKIAIILSFAVVGLKIIGVELPPEVNKDYVQIGAASIAGLLFVGNYIFTLITSKKVGLK